MMKSVQREKITETIELLFNFYHDKEQFMKLHVPLQEYLIKKIEETAQLTLSVLVRLGEVLKDEKHASASQYEIKEKALLSKTDQFKLGNKKNPSETFTNEDWNRNLLRVLESMSEAHSVNLSQLKKYYKSVDGAQGEVEKEEQRYRADVKSIFKELNSHFHEIDSNEKEQNKILTKLAKDYKAKEIKPSIHFLTEIKKSQSYLLKQIAAFVARNAKILYFVKSIVRNERQTSKKLQAILTNLSAKHKELYRSTPSAEKLDGVIAILEEGVQESRELFLEKNLISAQIQEDMTKLVPAEKSKVHHMMKYLELTVQNIEHKIGVKTRLELLAKNLSFKNFDGVSLAQGWIITTFTPARAYLTYDHFLALYDLDNNLLRKISSNSARISKVAQQNTIFLQETVKGFFTDSKEEYQVRFEDSDRMEEFILFIENQIN